MVKPVVFLDRDGVLITDVRNLTKPEQVVLAPGAAGVVRNLKRSGFCVVVVTNQPVVARGWLTESQVGEIHEHIQTLLGPEDGEISAFYFCPHHPNATVPKYRRECACRKPRPGMLLQAGKEFDLDLDRSYMVGDRITDTMAGLAAGCTTILVESGQHEAPPIQTSDPIDLSAKAHHQCRDLQAAARWILEQTP